MNNDLLIEAQGPSRFQLKPSPKNWHKIAELFLFTLAIPALGYGFNPTDPFYLQSGFLWITIPPLLLSLRYSLALGISSIAITSILLMISYGVSLVQGDFPFTLVTGMILLTILVGDTSSKWRTRLGRQQAENDYLQLRMDEFTRDYHILRLSHGQMQEYLAAQKFSLREALQQTKKLLETTPSDHLLSNISENIISIFAQFGWIQVAGLYPVEQGQLKLATPLSHIGNMNVLSIDDELIKAALHQSEMVSVVSEAHASESQKTLLLAVVPLMDARGKLHGILAIQEMHFMAFQKDNLNTLALLGGYIGDLLTRAKNRSTLNQKSAHSLSLELSTLLRFANQHDVKSVITVFKFKNEVDPRYIDFIAQRIRSLDSSRKATGTGNQRVLIILMPLMNQRRFQSYLNSLEKSFEQKFSQRLTDQISDIKHRVIARQDRLEDCLQFIKDINHDKAEQKAA